MTPVVFLISINVAGYHVIRTIGMRKSDDIDLYPLTSLGVQVSH